MIVSNYIHRNAWRLDTALVHGSGKTLSLSLQLFAERALVKKRLERAQAQLRELLLRVPDVTYFVDPEIETLYWLKGVAAVSDSASSIVAVRAKSIETWREWWRHDRMRVARLGKAISVLRQRSRLLLHALRLLLMSLACPRFLAQLICRERAWCLLHGSHPPRKYAGASRPAFAVPRESMPCIGLLAFDSHSY
jgi:hypothetical protein